MNPLIKAQVASAVRWLISLLCAALIKDGFDKSTVGGLSAALNPESIAAALMALGPLIWSCWQKHHANTALAVAAVTGISNATPTKAAVNAVSDVAASSVILGQGKAVDTSGQKS